jgi:hypothetical protein
MSLPPRPAEPGPPSTGSFLPLAFLGVVAFVVVGTLLVFFPGGLIVLLVLMLMVVAQYFLWGRWLHKAIEAEDAAEEELKARDRNGSK